MGGSEESRTVSCRPMADVCACVRASSHVKPNHSQELVAKLGLGGGTSEALQLAGCGQLAFQVISIVSIDPNAF